MSKPYHRPLRKSNVATNPDRVLPKGTTHLRDATTIRRLKMYNSRPVRNRQGKIIGGQYISRDTSHSTRITPNRRWFGNTRVVGQSELAQFREALDKSVKDPYTFILRQGKVPMGLIKDEKKQKQMHLLEVEPFNETFSAKRRQKKPKLKVYDYESLMKTVETSQESYIENKDRDAAEKQYVPREVVRENHFAKGQSKRIWGELYKVIDSSDVIVQVLDARSPEGTRSRRVEEAVRKHSASKHLVFVLNKCDLVPTWVTKRWVASLSQDYPTVAFHASMQNPFGKGALIQLLRQFGKLHSDKKQVCIGFVGYPNVGKSSVINTLRKKKVCNVAPVPGETKVWQYITLFKRIFLIDCPGVVAASDDSETDIVLKGVVRVESIDDPEDHVEEVLKRVKPQYIRRTYQIREWQDHIDFLKKFAQRSGKLLKKGEPDTKTAAKMVLHDWQRGKLPYFSYPPEMPVEKKRIAQERYEKEQRDKAAASAAASKAGMGHMRGKTPTDTDDDDGGAEEKRRSLTKQLVIKQKFDSIRVRGNWLEEDGKDPDRLTSSSSSSSLYKHADAIDNSDDDENDQVVVRQDESSSEEFIDYDQLLGAIEGDVVDHLPATTTTTTTSSRKKRQKKTHDNEKSAKSAYFDGFEETSKKRVTKRQVKPPRMTTNKRKIGKHFYETANVKNRNRNRKRPR